SKGRLEDAHYQSGYAAGSRWARDRAEYAELTHLQAASRELEDLIRTPADTPPWQRLFLQIQAHCAFWPSTDLSLHALAADWFANILGPDWATRVASPEFLIGFCAGALAVWTEVRLHVESRTPN